jgi:hypothetical protein
MLVHEPGKPAVPSMQTQDYDARARPWYQVGTALGKATEVGWTSPYRFLSTGDPGISAAVQLTRPDGDLLGVLGVDLKLADLSAVTAAAKVGQHGVALMLTDDNLVLALPRAPAGADLARWSTLVMQPVDTLALPAVTAAVNHWVAGGRQPLWWKPW